MSLPGTTSPSARRDLTFVNAANEPFHITVFQADSVAAPSANVAAPAVLFCVHGAGMSGDCFTRVAMRLIHRPGSDPNLSCNAGEGGDQTSGATPPPPLYDVPSATAHTAPLPPRPQLRKATTVPLSAVAPTVMGPHMPPPPGTAMPPGSASRPDTAAYPFLVATPESQAEDIDMCVITYDLRCHGTSTYAGGEAGLTLAVLKADFADILTYAKNTLFPDSNFYVVGHSLGGSIVANALAERKDLHDRVTGAVVIEAVEGTAKMSLEYMAEFLKRRPHSFRSVKEAETWFLQHGGMRNAEGAAVSVPPLLKQVGKEFVWRSKLEAMHSVWGEWFDGLDSAFVSLSFPKILCLATMERLDTPLMMAQMQGKFQFEVMGGGCGHYVMDDATSALVSKLRRFVKRIEVLTLKLKAATKTGAKTLAPPPGQLNNTTIPPNRW